MRADKTLDIKGLTDQRSMEVTRDVLVLMAGGQILRVIADAARAGETIAVLCEDAGYRLLSSEAEGGTVCLTIQK
ncbi:MAG: sulfurtransferase TusA family protein [Candidatus Geothermincolia bacterium]